MKKVILVVVVVLVLVAGVFSGKQIEERKTVNNIIDNNEIIEIVTQENKESANYLIRENENMVIMFADESYLIIKDNEYSFIPLVKEDITYTSKDIKEIENIIKDFYRSNPV